MTQIAYKIIDAGEWRQAIAEGRYEGSAVDRADGYIHLSTQAQLAETARRHYAGRDGLILLSVHLDRLEDAPVWEPSRGGDLFPHLYSPLPVTAVGEARPMTIDADGTMRVGEPA